MYHEDQVVALPCLHQLLENFGKADKTTDETFEENVFNYKKQENAATKLQKELQNYLKCVKAMSVASNSFYTAIKETYEDDWIGYTEVLNAVESLSMLWEDYLTTLTEQVQTPLHTYIGRFPEVKNKISKRNRKMTDFDSSRHTLSACQNAKKQDHTKIQRAQQDLNESQRIYEELNNDLHEELPALYDNRINFLASNFHAFFTSEAKFQEESAKCKTQVANCAERLADESSQQMFGKADSIRGGRVIAPDRQPSEEGSETSTNLSTFYNVKVPNDMEDRTSESERKSTPRESGADSDEPMPSPHVNHKANGLDEEEDDMVVRTSPEPPRDPPPPEPDYEPVTIGGQVKSELSPSAIGGGTYEVPAARDDDIYKVPINNQPIEDRLPKGVLYQVQATHPYTGEDMDELTFEAGDIINVIPFDDPEDQDEGWLMGMKEGKSEKGVFPANFTKRI